MTDKLRIVKDILKIIISILVISVFVKSCSKAYTIDDLIAYSEQITQMQNVNSRILLTAQSVVENKVFLKNKFESYNYTTWLVQYWGNKSYIQIYMYNDINNISNMGSAAFTTGSRIGLQKIDYNVSNNTFTNQTTFNNNSFYFDTWYGLITGNYANWASAPSNAYFNNKYIPPPTYTRLEFNQDPLEIVSYNGTLARYYQRRHLQHARNICWKNNTK